MTLEPQRLLQNPRLAHFRTKSSTDRMVPMSSALAATPSLLPGQRPPLYTVTSTDQAGVIVNVAAFCVVVAAVFVLVRGYVRFGIHVSQPGWSDGLVVMALVFFVIQSVLVIEEVKDGLGKTRELVDAVHLMRIQEVSAYTP